MHLLLHYVHLSSRLHILEVDEALREQRGLLMALPLSHKVSGTLRGLASILNNLSCDKILCLHDFSVHWKILCRRNYFFL